MNATIDVSNVVLETERLFLRPFEDDDLNDFYEYAKVDGVGQMAGWMPHESIETSKKILADFIMHKKTFAIVYKENNKVIGSVGIENLHNISEETLLNGYGRELGYVLSKDYWGKGLMSEAIKKVIEYLFKVVSLDYITCAYFIRNSRSKRVQEKCGFKYLKEIDYETSMGMIERSIMNILYNPYK